MHQPDAEHPDGAQHATAGQPAGAHSAAHSDATEHAAGQPATAGQPAGDGADLSRPVADPVDRPANKRFIAAWASWDWASAAFNAVVTSFVFSVYLTSASFGPDASFWWGIALGAAGLIVAVFAPVSGQRADLGGTRVRSLRVNTLIIAAVIGLMALVAPDPSYLWLGLVLIMVGNIAFELASVNYNAMLPEIAPKETMGRISAIGWGVGYLGGIVLLLALFFGFINPEVGLFGVTSENGMDVRVSMILCGVWTLAFSLPLLVMGRDDLSRRTTLHRDSWLESYRDSYRYLFTTVRRLWREDRRLLGFLGASAVFRDGLAGVFSMAGILASGSFGMSSGDVIVFAIVANVVAGVVTIASGWLDDRIGARRVILGALALMSVLGVSILILHERGTVVFWCLGLLLAACVGPVQSASRTFLARMTPAGAEGEIFGLYATTGRAVSFMAPLAFSGCILAAHKLLGLSMADAQIWGILGLVAILFAGLVLMCFVRDNQRIAR